MPKVVSDPYLVAIGEYTEDCIKLSSTSVRVGLKSGPCLESIGQILNTRREI